jgi:hypothetical protein
MEVIKAYRTRNDLAQIQQLPVKRTWMDNTWQKHAYHCFPVTLTNTLGWSLSFPEDITFIWDGISDYSPDHVKILSGEKYAYTGRANGTISFNTGITFKTEENISLLTMPAPNFFIDGASCFTTLISTSFFRSDLPVAWMITSPNKEITIPAGTPICSIIPISLSSINNSEIHLMNNASLPDNEHNPQYLQDYSNAIIEINKKLEWSDFYRDAVDHNGNTMGKHELKSLKLKVIENI